MTQCPVLPAVYRSLHLLRGFRGRGVPYYSISAASNRWSMATALLLPSLLQQSRKPIRLTTAPGR